MHQAKTDEEKMNFKDLIIVECVIEFIETNSL